MSIFTEQQAKAILDKVIALSKADECTATLAGSIDGNIRFALNNVSTSGMVTNAELAVQVAFGKRVGTASINEFDDASLERVVRRAEDLARLAPENPEFMPIIGKQDYKPSPTFSESTAAIDPEFRARVAADSIAPCRGHGLVAAGLCGTAASMLGIMNLRGQVVPRQAPSVCISIDFMLFRCMERQVATCPPQPTGRAASGPMKAAARFSNSSTQTARNAGNALPPAGPASLHSGPK